jgi:ribosomal 50S subunit-recycling heat shock protein
MRLDLFLKVSRLIVRRSLAQEFCDSGLIWVNGLAAKSSKEIKIGDEIEIRRRNRITKIRVLSVPAKKQISRSETDDLYSVLSDDAVSEDELT